MRPTQQRDRHQNQFGDPPGEAIGVVTSAGQAEGDLCAPLRFGLLSRAFGRDMAFMDARTEQMTSGVAEEYWPDMAGLECRDTVTDFEMPAGTFSTVQSCTC